MISLTNSPKISGVCLMSDKRKLRVEFTNFIDRLELDELTDDLMDWFVNNSKFKSVSVILTDEGENYGKG